MLDSWGVLCVILGELLNVIPYGISGLGRAQELGWPAGGGRGHRIRIILPRINSNTGSPGRRVHQGFQKPQKHDSVALSEFRTKSLHVPQSPFR